MSRYFPTAEYADDQPLARTILTTHVLARGATTGALIGGSIFAVRDLVYPRLRSSTATFKPATSASPVLPRLLRATGTGTVVGTALLAVALAFRMQGREDIEWRDRSWRLQHNRTQVAYDDWNCGGALAGLVGAALAGALKSASWRGMVGAAGAGSVVATVGYLPWSLAKKSEE